MKRAVFSATNLICPVCTTSGCVVERKLEDFALCRCPGCGHCFTDLDSIDGLEPYDAGYFEEEHRNWFLHPNFALYNKLSRVIEQYKISASVLDIGCGNGSFLRYLKHANAQLSLTGIDISDNQSAPGIEYLRGDFFGVGFDRQFDVLVNLAVIEHVPNVIAFTERMHQLCVPGGLVITMTVDERSLIYRASRVLDRAGYSTPLKRLYGKHHLNHFTDSSLRRLLEQHGLPTVQVIRHNSPMAAVDLPQLSNFSAAILRAGVWGGFQLGMLTGQTMLQTVISRKAA